jgi:hypothetical protein
MRAQAVAAMTIAPAIAIACLQLPRHCQEERDHCANKGRPQRHEGDLFKDEGDAAGN